MKALALFSGGLDSIIAVKIIQSQGIDVQGVTFETPFFSARRAISAAASISLPLLVLDITDEHLAMLRAPRYGYGKNLNPCIDCHALMIRKAGEVMESLGAEFIITGEVLGQRAMSQTRQSLHVVAKLSGYQDKVLRPLSAKLLPITEPEREGKINRDLLYDIQGRSRRRQMEAAAHFGITDYSTPAGGCLLTDPMFVKRLRELFDHNDFDISSIHLLRSGRHFRIDGNTKVIVGRNQSDNRQIHQYSQDSDLIIQMCDYPGPTTLVPGGCGEKEMHIAASLCALYSDAPKGELVRVSCEQGEKTFIIETRSADRDQAAQWII
ncbi:MAG: tRNA 4-thiouridine(8) synthase ThiI [Syntrophaceae bacterium]|nr:tRNA 4-thiouridine(8) synthase ThiI [Syntrophaceae bacterium]